MGKTVAQGVKFELLVLLSGSFIQPKAVIAFISLPFFDEAFTKGGLPLQMVTPSNWHLAEAHRLE